VVDWILPEAVEELLSKTIHRLEVIALDGDIGCCLQDYSLLTRSCGIVILKEGQ